MENYMRGKAHSQAQQIIKAQLEVVPDISVNIGSGNIWGLFGANPLPEPMMISSHLGP